MDKIDDISEKLFDENIFEDLNKLYTDEELIEKYSLNKDDFLDQADLNAFLFYLKESDNALCEMATIRGNEVKTDKLPFTFYISDKQAVHGTHAIRAKIYWNPARSTSSYDGYMYLHGEYEYVAGSHKYKPTNKEISIARTFFKKYKVLFAAVWELYLQALDLELFFEGRISLKQLLSRIEIDEDDPESINYYNINHCANIEQLETLVRKDKLWNMND